MMAQLRIAFQKRARSVSFSDAFTLVTCKFDRVCCRSSLDGKLLTIMAKRTISLEFGSLYIITIWVRHLVVWLEHFIGVNRLI